MQLGARALRRGAQHSGHGGLLLITGGEPALEYSGLFSGNLLDRVAQDAGVVEADVGDYGAVGAGDDVRRIQPPAHADLEHDILAAAVGEPPEGRGGHQLELGALFAHALGGHG